MKEKFKNVSFEIDTSKTGSRLKDFRQSKKITLKELSEKTGLSEGMISESENGKNKPSPNLMFALKKLYNVNMNWLLTGEGEMLLSEKAAASGQDDSVMVPQISAASCGSSGRILDSEIEDYKAFEARFIHRFKNPVVCKALGDSMKPVIREGDLLLIDRDVEKRLQPDGLHLYLVNNPESGEEVAITVKKVALSGKILALVPLNFDFNPVTVDLKGKNILDIVLGQVVWIGRELV